MESQGLNKCLERFRKENKIKTSKNNTRNPQRYFQARMHEFVPTINFIYRIACLYTAMFRNIQKMIFSVVFEFPASNSHLKCGNTVMLASF